MPTIDERLARLHRDAPLTDVHAHPSLKAFLFGRNLWRHYRSGSTFNPFSSRSDLASLARGGVRVLWSAHYVPEREIFRDCWLASVASWFVPSLRRLQRGSPFDSLLDMMATLEREAARRPDRAGIARSLKELDEHRRENRIALVHTVEGLHALGGNADRLDKLAELGVAMVTLSHFYDNNIAAQVDGIPKDMAIRGLCAFEFGLGRRPVLTDLGRTMLRRMQHLRILVDVTHLSAAARAAVFNEVATDRPIVASHIGVQRFRRDPYNLHDDEIREIARRGGAVGVIFMPYWLSTDHAGKDGLTLIGDTMEHIASVTGSWSHVMIGTDFDGFTTPPRAVADASRLPTVTDMLFERGVSEADVLKALGGNALRVLQESWR
jgi:membrane dipeptidase